jgi:D-alanine-D-alanine ligase
MKRQSIACVLDDDIARAVTREEAICRRALYDISVVRSLRRLGHEVHPLATGDNDRRIVDKLLRLAPDIVVNLAFSATSLEAPFAGALESLGLAYTGSGPLGIALANDKVRSRHLMRAAGVPVPRFIELDRSRRASAIDFDPPYIVKPISLGNSDGIHARSVVNTIEQARRLADRTWRRFAIHSVCDAFIVGREFQIGLVETGRGRFRLTAIVELHFEGATSGRGFKTEALNVKGKRIRVYPVRVRIAQLPARAAAEMIAISRLAARVLDLRGYAKIDLRMSCDGSIFVIEANANPGLWSKSLIWSRPGFDANLTAILHAAVRRVCE